MFSDIGKIILGDCCVIEIGDQVVYPIFKNGYSSIVNSTQGRAIYNNDIKNFSNINIIVREPQQRFIKGVKEYCWINHLDITDTYKKISQGLIMDKHFAPQFLWLLHLNKFYKGKITLREMKYLSNIIDVQANQSKWQLPEKQKLFKQHHIESLPEFTEVDKKLFQHLDSPIQINELINRYKHVLSKT